MGGSVSSFSLPGKELKGRKSFECGRWQVRNLKHGRQNQQLKKGGGGAHARSRHTEKKTFHQTDGILRELKIQSVLEG